MGGRESTQSSSNIDKANTAVAAVGVAMAALAVVGALRRLFGGGSDSGKKTMKAPGRNHRIFRDDFERDTGSYFRDLRK